MPEDEPGELVDGRLEEEEMATYVHEFVVSWLLQTIGAWLGARGGYVFPSEIKLGVAPGRGRKPDLSVHLPGGTRPHGRAKVGRLPPDIVVEVVSDRPRDARRDRVDKHQDYATFGVRWYWIVDPQLHAFEVRELGGDGRYVDTLAASEGTVDVPGCDGLRLELDDLWRRVEELEATPEE